MRITLLRVPSWLHIMSRSATSRSPWVSLRLQSNADADNNLYLSAGSESLSLDEQDLYKHLVKELQSDGTLSSDISELLNELQMSSSNASSSAARSVLAPSCTRRKLIYFLPGSGNDLQSRKSSNRQTCCQAVCCQRVLTCVPCHLISPSWESAKIT